MDLNNVLSISSQDLPENSGFSAVLARAKAGDQEALAEIYELYFKKIYRFIFFRVGHKEQAEDLAEDVFLKAFVKLASLQEAQAFEGWIYQIARNLVIDYYRQKKLTISLEDIENTLEYESNIIDVLYLQHQQKILLRLLKELVPQQQLVLKLKFFEGLDNAEIAELLAISEGAVRVAQHRAMARLADFIKKLKQQGKE